MKDEARLQLMRDQSALIRALVQSGTVPDEFDNERLQIAAQALVYKRMRSVARNCPNLTAALGDQFSTLFNGCDRSSERSSGHLISGVKEFVEVVPSI